MGRKLVTQNLYAGSWAGAGGAPILAAMSEYSRELSGAVTGEAQRRSELVLDQQEFLVAVVAALRTDVVRTLDRPAI